MDSGIVSYGFQYVGILIEAGLVILVARRSHRNRLAGVLLYLSCLLATDLARAYALRIYGLTSRQYFYVYFTTDFLLVISAFFLVCLFFRRACLHQEKMWRFIRLLLAFICILVVGVSGLLFSHNYGNLLTGFIVEFNQNLYFTCLVLNTLLYLLLQQIDSADDQLGLLVCGVGIQFAGPAATLALFHLMTGEGFAQSLAHFTIPLCTMGMLLVWAYATLQVKEKAIKVARRQIPVLAEVAAHLNIQV
jgi:hypothetical protein